MTLRIDHMAHDFASFDRAHVAADPDGVQAYAQAILAGSAGISSGMHVDGVAKQSIGQDISSGISR